MTVTADLGTTKARRYRRSVRKRHIILAAPASCPSISSWSSWFRLSAMPAGAANRRQFLQLLAGAAALPVASHAWAQSGPVGSDFARLTVTPAGPLRVVSGAGGNVVVTKGATGVLLVNGGVQAHSSYLLGEIAS